MRPTEAEHLAYFHFWREVGRRMGIKEIPKTCDAFDAFNVQFERDRFAFADTNRRVAESTMRMMCGWFPRPVRGLVRKGMIAVMDEPLRTAVGMEAVSPNFANRVLATLRLRATLLKHVPRRGRPLLRTAMRHRSYPGRHEVEKLGPPEVPRTA